MKNNHHNIQQINQEEEDSSLTIVDLPVSERVLDSNRENQKKREETPLNNNNKQFGQPQTAASNNHVFESIEKQRDNPLLLRKGYTKKYIDEKP